MSEGNVLVNNGFMYLPIYLMPWVLSIAMANVVFSVSRILIFRRRWCLDILRNSNIWYFLNFNSTHVYVIFVKYLNSVHSMVYIAASMNKWKYKWETYFKYW